MKSSLQSAILNTSPRLFLLQKPIHWLFERSFSPNSLLDTTAQFPLQAAFLFNLAFWLDNFIHIPCLPVCWNSCCNYPSPYWVTPLDVPQAPQTQHDPNLIIFPLKLLSSLEVPMIASSTTINLLNSDMWEPSPTFQHYLPNCIAKWSVVSHISHIHPSPSIAPV